MAETVYVNCELAEDEGDIIESTHLRLDTMRETA